MKNSRMIKNIFYLEKQLLRFMHIYNYNILCEWYDWVMVDFTPPYNYSDIPQNAKGRFYNEHFYLAII